MQLAATPQIDPATTRLGWIGTGVMGRSMCGHLLRAGYKITVFNRTPARAEELLAQGATWAKTPAEVAQRSDVVLTMVGFPADVREVYQGSAGILSQTRPGMVLVDFTTSEPALAVELSAQALELGAWAIDAPVSGGDVGAREARLSLMLGGDQAVITGLEPIWSKVGKVIVRQGGPGAGQHTKLVNQILVAAGMVGVCEALLYGAAAGLDVEQVLTSVSSGAAGSWSLSNLGPRILKGDFAPGFLVNHFVKDLGIALQEAARLQLCLPGLALARQLYQAVQAQGDGQLGTHALQLALARMSGRDWRTLLAR